jgi:hypothetical protein
MISGQELEVQLQKLHQTTASHPEKKFITGHASSESHIEL